LPPYRVSFPNNISIFSIAAGGTECLAVAGVLRSVLGEELLYALRQSKVPFSDLILRSRDGEALATHRCVILARAGAFLQVEKESSPAVFVLPFRAASIRVFLAFLYSDRIDDLPNDIRNEVAEMAKRYALVRLRMLASDEVQMSKAKSTMKEDFGRLFTEHAICDYRLTVQDAKIDCHRFFLAARCRYFAAMFDSNMAEATKTTLDVLDVEPDTMLALMRYVYSDEVTQDPTVAVDLLSLANLYQVSRLKQLCVGVIEKGVDDETISYVYQAAMLYEAPNLVEFCREYIARNITTVSKSQSWNELPPEARTQLQEEATKLARR